MRIVVAGLPPAQSTALVHDFPQHDLRMIGAQSPPSQITCHAKACDLCVVNTRLISHTVTNILRRKRIPFTTVHGYSSAVAAIARVFGVRRAA